MMKWQSGSDCGVVELCVPVTIKEKTAFADYILDVVRDGWNVEIFVEHCNDNKDNE